MLMAAGLTAMININGAVAALLPMAVMVAVRQRLRPSPLLMPLAFAASAGSVILLTGSPVNVIISDAAAEGGVGRFAHLRVGADSTLVGRARTDLDLTGYARLNVITVTVGDTVRPTSSGRFDVGDELTMTGDRGVVEAYAVDAGLSIEDMLDRERVTAALVGRDHGIAEVVVSP